MSGSGSTLAGAPCWPRSEGSAMSAPDRPVSATARIMWVR